MRYLILLSSVLILTSLSSCVEIIDDLSLNADGSGTFKYNVNFSSSTVKINSILSLDSLDGKKIPSMSEIKSKINSAFEQIKKEEGISNATLSCDYENYIFKLKCDFSSLDMLQKAIKNTVRAQSKRKDISELNHDWLTFNSSELKRSVPEISIKKKETLDENEKAELKKGSYTSITRFKSNIEKYDNQNATVSANKKAIMIRTNPFLLMQNPQLLDNVIYLEKNED